MDLFVACTASLLERDVAWGARSSQLSAERALKTGAHVESVWPALLPPFPSVH